MKKSLLITYFFPPKLGGIENFLKNLSRNLPPEKIVVLTELERDSQKIDQGFNFKIIRKKLFPWSFFKPSWLPLLWRLKKIIKEEKIEVIQFGHYSNLVTLGLIYKKLFRIPYFVYTHGVDTLIPQKSWFMKKLMISNLKNTKWIIANSQYMKNRLKKLGIFEAKIVILYPSISAHKFEKEVEVKPLIDEYNLKNKKVILTIGRLVERKGQDMVIRALPRVLEKFPEARYLIVGEGPYHASLENLVNNLSLKEKVIFCGSIEDKMIKKLPFYNLADLFIMPTREIDEEKDIESFGLVYLEAQATATPVIIGRAGGTKETIIEGETGLSVDPLNPKEISEVIIKLLSDDNLRKKMGEKGKKWVTGTFNWENQINKVKYLLEKPTVVKDKPDIPAISVIIPAYNVAPYISDCLESIFKQTFKDFEIIVVNDGSKDNLLNVLEKDKNRLNLINQENKGAAAARNAGARIAQGKYLFFCDADIILEPMIFEKMVRVLEINSFVSFCYCAFNFGPFRMRALPYSAERLKKLNYISTMSLLRKKDFPYFDESLKRFQDWDLWLRLSQKGKRGLALEDFLFKAPIRQRGKSRGVPRPGEEAVKIIKKKHNLP